MSSPAGFAFKKRFGQHFLRDTGAIERIVRLIAPAPGDSLLEIGAGDGAISTRLASRASRLMALEYDRECWPLLEQALRAYPGARLIRGDILTIDIPGLVGPLFPHSRVRIAGNLPYNIATAVIGKLLSLRLPFADMTFMLQLEVARRITAPPGTRDYGLLSVQCQHHAEVRLHFTVAPACFVPRPRVISAVVTFRPYGPVRDPGLETRFTEILRAAFAYRRKTIANAFSRNPLTAPVAGQLLQRAGIDGGRRAEALTVAEYESLAAVSLRLRDSDIG